MNTRGISIPLEGFATAEKPLRIDVVYGLAVLRGGYAVSLHPVSPPTEEPRPKLPPLAWLAYWVRYLLTGKGYKPELFEDWPTPWGKVE